MTNTEALCIFLQGAMSKQERDRYLELISSKKGQEKFLRDLDHSIESHIFESCKVEELTQQQWNQAGYLFTSRGVFGQPVEMLRTTYESAPWDGGWLLIGQSGIFGIFRPEGRIDDEIYIEF